MTSLPVTSDFSPLTYEEQVERWLADNPGKKFADYYVESVTSRLNAGDAHETLGAKLTAGRSFQEAGAGGLQLLVQWGLKPGHVCVDYGCGSLRIGLHIMNYLDPGKYWGLDVTSTFFEDGKKIIGEDIIHKKKPNLHVIDEASLALTAEAAPDYVLSVGVLSHVPPTELGVFFDGFMRVTRSRTRSYLKFRTAASETRFSPVTWAHDLARIKECLRQRDGRWERVGGKRMVKAGVVMDDHWWCITRS